MAHRSSPIAAAALLALLGAGCGKQTFLAVAMLQTPSVPNPIVPSQPIPAQAVVTAWLGTIDTSNPTQIDSSKIEGVTRARGAIAFRTSAREDRNLALKEQGQGAYLLDSVSEPGFAPVADDQYTLVLEGGEGDEAYGAKLLPAPATRIKEFPQERVLNWTAPQAFTVTRTDGPAKDGRLLPVFVTVVKVDPQNPSSAPAPTWSNVPQDATSLLKFALSDEPYRVSSVQIPASAFTGNGFFVVTLLVVRYGLVSDNTFLGSTAVTAAGDAGLVVIQ